VAQDRQRLLVAVGGNLPLRGDPPEKTILQAFHLLAARGLSGLAVSRFYRTPCFPAGAGPDYVNAAFAAVVPPKLSPSEILALLHEVEAELGRTRDTRWGMRTLDLDLIACGDAVVPDGATQDHWRSLPPEIQRNTAPDRLILPHPRVQDRAFVLVPLADVAPDWRHPRLNLTVAQMLAALPARDREEVVPLSV
jgi:2-amino-4-hydroxy-6-hydroxymethyldihydropteridine diphosphokinase